MATGHLSARIVHGRRYFAAEDIDRLVAREPSSAAVPPSSLYVQAWRAICAGTELVDVVAECGVTARAVESMAIDVARLRRGLFLDADSVAALAKLAPDSPINSASAVVAAVRREADVNRYVRERAEGKVKEAAALLGEEHAKREAAEREAAELRETVAALERRNAELRATLEPEIRRLRESNADLQARVDALEAPRH